MKPTSVIASFFVFPCIAYAASDNRQIEEVIVTAERQEASTQDTSISISAFTSEMLTDFGIRNQEDLQNFIPATTIQPYDATIRGVGRNFRNLGGDPGASTYINGVYSEDLLTATAATFWDVARIEVLRGPQGTLYGRNAIAGAINIIYEKPSNEIDYAFKVIGGNFDTKEYYGMINGGLIDDVLSARFNFSVRDRDGIVKEIGGGDDLDGLGTENYAVQFKWTPTASLELNIRANKMEIDRPFGGASGGGVVVLNELGADSRNTKNLVPGFRSIDTNNTDIANYLDRDWHNTNLPILSFIDPDTGAEVLAQHNRAGIDLAQFAGNQNAAASLDGFNETSDESAARYNDCVFPGSIKGDDVCAATNGLNNEQFNQQGVQFSTVWDINETLQLKYIYGYNKVSYQRTTDNDNTGSLFHDRQFYVNHEARYSSHELQAFYDFGDSLSFTSGIFFYDSTIDQRGDFYSSLGEARFIDPYQDNTGLAPAFWGTGPTATLHSAKASCQVENPAPSCVRNASIDNSSANNLHLSQWYGDDGTNPDLDVQHGIASLGSDTLYHTQTAKKAFALYTQGTWDMNDDLTLTLGLRYASDEIKAEENLFQYSEAAGEFLDSGALGLDLAVYNILNGGLVPDPDHIGGWAPTEKIVNGGIPLSVSVYRPFERKDETVTWRVNLDWRYTDNSLLYLSATSGTRAGGYNLGFFSASPSYEPEELIAYELGAKNQFFNNTVQLNASVYIYDYKSIHTFITEVTEPLIPGERAGLSTSVISAPGVDIWGVEFDVYWLASDNWTLGGNFSYTPSEYSKDLFVKDTASLKTPESLFTTYEGQVQNINGNQLLQVPELKYTAWANYGWPLADGSRIELSGVYSWIDDVYYSPFEADEEKAEAYDRVDLRATWTSATNSWTVSAFANNVFDDIGIIQVIAQGEEESFRHSAGTTVPRLYGVELTYRLTR